LLRCATIQSIKKRRKSQASPYNILSEIANERGNIITQIQAGTAMGVGKSLKEHTAVFIDKYFFAKRFFVRKTFWSKLMDYYRFVWTLEHDHKA